LLRALAQARRAFVYEPLRGYGVARVCRSCGESAACTECRGTVRMERGSVRCAVCGAEGRCATCGSNDFGIARGGAERVEEWARTVTRVPVQHLEPSAPARPPADPEVLVGGVDTVKDFGPLGLDLVAILNADVSLRRPGLAARERALTTWFEAAAWARRDGRVIVQTAHPNDPAVQALVAGRPARFHRAESARLEEAGFPAGAAVFRVVGDAELESVLDGLPHHALLVSSTSEATVCLLALDPADVARFGEAMRRCAERGVVSRVEAEPHV
jgi:primosomal protein N' (replication factor Y)